MKKIFGIGVLIALIFLALHFQVGGRTVKDYLLDFFRTPIVQEAIRQGKEAVTGYLQKDVADPPSDAGPNMEMDKVSDEDRKELEKVLEKEVRGK